ncbi:hypothetical protein [uncultured Roseobacter sp.]|uniref:hypothetical protein n=1 Tax=uncultured Roseobacter sp. TaxID=114847 RepID=UPI00262B0EDE|nr:hypothetical protein [uncultured Roseobacter sp.]
MSRIAPQRRPAAPARAPAPASSQSQSRAETAATHWQETADRSPAVSRLQLLQRKADAGQAVPSGSGPPIQRKVVINGKVYGSRRELAMSQDDAAFGAFQDVTDDDKVDKLSSDTLYEVSGTALVEAEGEAAAEAPELRESPEDRRAREEEAARQQTELEKEEWGARLDDLKVQIAAGDYRTHGRSFAHLAESAGGDGLTRFDSRGAVYAYLKTKADDFTCQGAQEFDRRPAGIFRATIESEHMGDTSRRGGIILLLLSTGRVVLHHFGNI